MVNTTNQFIYSSSPYSLSFIIVSSVIILFFIIFSPLIKFQKIKIKWINTKTLLFFSSILGLIVGLIFSSFNQFNKLDNNTIKNHFWVWEAISYVYSFGMFFISFMLLTVWFIIPLMTFRTIKKFLTRHDYNIEHELRKLGYVFIFIIITIAISNIGWVFPLNDPQTPLKVFKIDNHKFMHDQWFYINKFMFENCYFTEWYSWVFLAYFILNLLISYLFIKIKLHNIYSLINVEYHLKKIGHAFHLLDSFGPLASYCFISAYCLFNLTSLFIHIAYIIIILASCYILISILLMMIFTIKFKKEHHKYQKLKELFILGFINHFSINKPKHKFKTINITDVSIVALAFTIYMGFAYNFNVDINNQIIYTSPMYSVSFWLQIVINSFLFNVVSESRSYNSSWTKLIFAEATYSVTPGMQTSVLMWINPLFKPFSNFINNMVCLLI